MRTRHLALLGFLSSISALSWACSSDDGKASATNPNEPGSSSGVVVELPDGGKIIQLPDGGQLVIDPITGEAGAGTSSGGTSGAPPVTPYTDFDINHILFTGQSNSVSNSGTPVATTTQPYGNLMFDTGVMPGRGSKSWPDGVACDGAGCVKYDTPTSFVPLVEGDLFFNYKVETAASSIANEISFLAQDFYKDKIPGLPNKHDSLVSLHGRSGNTYWCLRKTGCDYKPGYNQPFEQGMQEVDSAKQLAAAANKSYVVRAVVNIHGESDHYSYTAGVQEFPNSGSDGTPNKIQNYADALVEWQADYESSVKERTNQTLPVPMFISQVSGWNDTKYSKVAQYQLEAHERAAGKVILIGPSYATDIAQDCRHFTALGVRQIGEQFGKVYAKVVLEGKTWEPVRPKAPITRNGAEITVPFHVPVPPLVLDTEKIAAMKDMGFEYLNRDGVVQTISKVELAGPDTVKITLASDPGAGRLTYAQNQTPNTCIGNPNGARGNLRDSDNTPSRNGYPLHNWSVHFDVAVP